MHEEEFSSKPHLYHRSLWTKTPSIQNCEILQIPSGAPSVPMFFRIRAFSLVCFLSFPSTLEVGWWVWFCITPFSDNAEISAFPLTSVTWPLNMPESRMCTPFRVMHVQWTLLFQKLSLCILSQNLGDILTYVFPVLVTAMLWLGETIPNDSIKCWWCQ